MPASLDSSRPIMAPSNRTSVRYSTYSMASSMTPSMAPAARTSDSAAAEIQTLQKGLERMENKALSQQRVVLSEEKSAYFSKLALGAKLERALGRRMASQDAEFRKRSSTVPKAPVAVTVAVVVGGDKEKV